MDFFKFFIIIVICCESVVTRTNKSSLSNKYKNVCLTRTKLTIFIDWLQETSHWARDSIGDYCRYPAEPVLNGNSI